MLDKRGPIIHPWDTPKTNSIHVPYELFILVLCLLFNKLSWNSLKAVKLKPYALNFAVRGFLFRQLNALERFVGKVPNVLPLSIELFHFSNKNKRRYWTQNPFLKSEWYFPKISKKLDISLNILLWNCLIKLEAWLLAYSFLLSFHYIFYTMMLYQHILRMMEK